ncbi:MAG: PEP-utilizing enzyme [Patescibacteria group bacterium]|nr:PEP-utilizing enzyme [Patescibacteria group bacterium]
MKKIEKILSRDMTAIDMRAWEIGLLGGLKRWLGWSYSDLIFYFHDKYSDVILLREEHYGKFLNFVLKKIKQDANWFPAEYQKFVSLTREFFSFFSGARKKLSKKISRGEIVDIYQTYCGYMAKHFGPFVVMKWLPIWLEDKPALNKSFSREVKLAVKARQISEKTLPQGRELCALIMEAVAAKLSSVKSLTDFITEKEFLAFLEKGEKPDVKELKKRKAGFICSRRGVFLTGGRPAKAQRILAKSGYSYDFSSLEKIQDFKGQAAFRGLARGRVRLIMIKKEIGDIRKGEILVTSMTTPEYLPAMKKSAAFITDEGGVTCHAAIIAREMKKPCVIGTKIATKVLKTGDLVEVDAINGIIKKLDSFK